MSKKANYLSAAIAIACIIAYIRFDNQDAAQAPQIEEQSKPQLTEEVAKVAPVESDVLAREDIPEVALKEYDAYQQLFGLRESVQQFFDEADSLDEETKKQKQQALEEELNQLAEQKRLSQSEKLMLQLAFIKLNPDTESAKKQAEVLISEYQKIAEARHQAFVNNPSENFKNYKLKEKTIVAEIMQMETFPDGLTRDQYLAKRLAEARADAYQVKVGD